MRYYYLGKGGKILSNNKERKNDRQKGRKGGPERTVYATPTITNFKGIRD